MNKESIILGKMTLLRGAEGLVSTFPGADRKRPHEPLEGWFLVETSGVCALLTCGLDLHHFRPIFLFNRGNYII